MRAGYLVGTLLLLAAGGAGAEAATPVPGDFAQDIPLTLDPGGALYALELPDAVYQGIRRTDLGDLRVFNGRGEVVPQTLVRRSPPAGAAPAPLDLPLFPLHGTDATGPAALHIRIGPGGALIETEAPRAQASAGAYLLDLSQVNRTALRSLRLKWQDPSGEGFVAQVRIEASNDLAHWRPAGDGALADLAFGGKRLRRDVLRPRKWARYLRIRWPAKLAAVSLERVQALAAAATSPEPVRHRHDVVGESTGRNGEYRFDAGALLPADRIQVRLPQPNTLVPARLDARADGNAPWQPRFRGPLYDLRVDGLHLRNEPAASAPVMLRYWRLRVGAEGGGLGSGSPVLELAWVPHRLLFLARGDGPYVLAFGSARVGPAGGDGLLRRLAADPGRIRSAHAGKPRPLGGAAALAPAPRPLPWGRIALWAVLVACVLVLGWMARRVYRQLSEQGDSRS